ncbi:MAG: biotin/lipoate A/B protein ligase family protein [Candidatus Hydrogenedentota bacterium]
MRWMDITLPTPAENLALDEVLLDSAESGRAGDTLRFWESTAPFVVLGTAQVLRAEVRETACAADEVPILRRCSAGGCVLQGPGCLNYTLVLTFARFPQVRKLHDSYQYILGRVAHAFSLHGVDAAPAGVSDLAVAGQKISGNAQRRRRHAILHHGTLLYAPNVASMTQYLKEPADQPAYRGGRAHRAFVGRLPLAPETLRAALCAAFSAHDPADRPLAEEMAASAALAREKYTQREWTYRR